MHATTTEIQQAACRESPSHDIGVVWVAHPSRRLAAHVVCTLRSLNLQAKLWDEAHAGGNAPSDIVVADSTGLRLIAGCLAGSRSSATRWDRACRGGLAPGVLRRVLDHVEKRLGEKMDICELAAISGLSECHFSRAFKQSVGMPPHRYVMSRRIAISAGLLERTERPMTEVALAVGFSDHSHFTRMFVRLTGETPSSYRHRHR